MQLRDLPSVDRLARAVSHRDLPRGIVVEVCRQAVEEARHRLAERGDASDPRAEAQARIDRLARSRPTSVINATGVLLHTNLGRAPLAEGAADVAADVAVHYTNLEMDLAAGRRGGRGAYLQELLTHLTGAEAAIAVNNNAAGLLLTLTALASGRPVPVSRGELIEIGGSYRLPELMGASGAIMVEVGTTNRTRVSDYEAVARDAAFLLKVHPSNYRVQGFTEEADLAELVGVARSAGIPLVFDCGSGLLDTDVPWIPGPPPAWLADEPGVVQSLEQGADLVLFSGDKLLGGPQAGIVVGRSELVARMRRHPMARALRMDGPTLAALEATLEAYADGRALDIPFWRMATADFGELARRAEAVIAEAGIDATVVPSAATPGAGSVPGSTIPSPAIEPLGIDTDRTYRALLDHEPPVVAHRHQGHLLVEIRSVLPSQDAALAAALAAACRS